MPYVNPDAKSGADLRRRVEAGEVFHVYQPGPFGPIADKSVIKGKSYVFVEGPHYPKPHSYYVTVEVDDDDRVVNVLTGAQSAKLYR